MVTIYTKPNCPQCDTTKLFLNQKGIAFEDKPLETSPEIFSLIEEKGYKSAPVVVSGSDSWSGFRPDKLASLIA